MKKIFIKLLLAGFPLLTVVAIYFYNDPFKVLYHYDHLEQPDGVSFITLNRDYLSTEMFLKNYDKYKYDSYIFGSSRSGFYPVAEWQKHIGSTACFHYDAYLESLFGVEKKIELLHEKHVQIKNALFVIDNELLGVTANHIGPIYRKHPMISGERKIDFQLTMFRYFLDVDFLTAYTKFLVTHKVTAEMISKGLSGNSITHYDETINEETESGYEELILKNRDSFYQARSGIFYKRESTQHYADPTIKQTQLKMLNNIKKILDEDATQYRIVINPLYNQKKLDTADLATLRSIFGEDKVFDFSGINEITQNVYNYYEASHYRPQAATQIMNMIYSPR